MTMAKPDPEFLLYPLLNSDDPLCSTCQEPMELLTYEARGKAPKPDFVPSAAHVAVARKGFWLKHLV
jgi:hypothetical protein